MVAALFVQPRGCYVGLPDVDPWDEARDARKYSGPHPVVAHPPCSRWCQLAAVNEKRYGHKRGDDGGCFASALASVRKFGGVLEHPASTLAWPAHDLPTPPIRGWLKTECGGFVCQVAQRNYGHPARKLTWLYAHGVELPDLVWGHGPEPEAWCSQSTNHGTTNKRRLGKREASATPPAFRDILLAMARHPFRGGMVLQ